jgi:hypothetical protein
MLGVDVLSLLLGLGVLVLVVTTTLMLMEFLPGSRSRRGPTSRGSSNSGLSAGAAQAVAEARARAAAASVVMGIGAPVTGQIVDLADSRWTDRQMSVDDANALAMHFAETDPQRVAEVINQWIRADSTDEPTT